MIPIARGAPDEGEALKLSAVELSELHRVRALIAAEGRDPVGDEIGTSYRVAGELLWRRQGRKCAYCEADEQKRRNDVEHYRPKARANRRPGSLATHGYWWLAWRWENLLYACRNCNQILDRDRGKQDHFPLDHGSAVLVAEQIPGASGVFESTLLIDPSTESGIDHMDFECLRVGGAWQWRPRPLTEKGRETIRVCALDRDDLIEKYAAHVDGTVRREVDRLEKLGHPVADDVWRSTWASVERWLYAPTRPYVALSYSALRVLVPDEELAEHCAVRRRPEDCWG